MKWESSTFAKSSSLNWKWLYAMTLPIWSFIYGLEEIDSFCNFKSNHKVKFPLSKSSKRMKAIFQLFWNLPNILSERPKTSWMRPTRIGLKKLSEAKRLPVSHRFCWRSLPVYSLMPCPICCRPFLQPFCSHFATTCLPVSCLTY